ncbi:cytochrome P450 [Salix suchowensis]|nr:cytochrome P450 [Salix suchowensis]
MPAEQRISDEDILHNINTFMFAGSDTSSLSLTWMLLLLAQNPHVQDKLRAELQTVASPSGDLTTEEIQSLYSAVSDLPYLDNVVVKSFVSYPRPFVYQSRHARRRDPYVIPSAPKRRRRQRQT